MNNNYTAEIKQDVDCWLGWMEEVPGVAGQEVTQAELVESVRTTLQEALAFYS